MCMICNLPHNEEVASDFLTKFDRARIAMKAATEAMAKARDAAPDSITRDFYDATHKKLVRIGRDWNRTEHTREPGVGFVSPSKPTREPGNTPES